MNDATKTTVVLASRCLFENLKVSVIERGFERTSDGLFIFGIKPLGSPVNTIHVSDVA